jgi:deoxyribonuclease-1
MKIIITLLISIFITIPALAVNQEVQSFSKAKKILEKKIYDNHRITLYCSAEFDAKKQVTPPQGFTTSKYL